MLSEPFISTNRGLGPERSISMVSNRKLLFFFHTSLGCRLNFASCFSFLFIFFIFCLFPCTSRLLRPAEAEKNIKFHSNCLKTDIFNHHRMRFVVFFMFLSASHCFFFASIFLFCWRIAEPALFAHSHFLSLTPNHNIRTIYTVNSFVRCCC